MKVVIETMNLGMAFDKDETRIGLIKNAPVINERLMEQVLGVKTSGERSVQSQTQQRKRGDRRNDR